MKSTVTGVCSGASICVEYGGGGATDFECIDNSRPDLIISSVEAASPVVIDDPVTVSVGVTNQGGGPVASQGSGWCSGFLRSDL